MTHLKRFAAPWLVIAMVLSSCAGTPFGTAQTVEQKADAAYAQYVIAKEQAAVLIADPALSDAIKIPIARAAVASKKPADALETALATYAQAEADLKAGATTADKVQIAANDLQQWVNTASPLITTLVDQIAKVKP